MTNIHAARATDGLPAHGRAAWRICAVCDQWVIAAFVDMLPTSLYPKPLSRDKVVTALVNEYPLHRIRGSMDGVVKGTVVWLSPPRLARWLLDHPTEEPADVYLEHPHHTYKDPEPSKKKRTPDPWLHNTPSTEPPPF